MSENNADGVLSVEEAAQALAISRGLAYAAIHRGEIPHVRLGKRIIIPRRLFEAKFPGVLAVPADAQVA